MTQKWSPVRRYYCDVCRRYRPRPATEAKIIKNLGNPSQIIKNVFFTNFSWTVLRHYLELGAGIWPGGKRDSEFSFSEKKLVEKNRSKKNDRKKQLVDFFSTQNLLVDKISDRKFSSRKKKVDQKNFDRKFSHQKLRIAVVLLPAPTLQRGQPV